MGTSRIYVTTLCLAAVVLLPVPGFSASPNAAPQASADKAKDDGCGRGGQEPSPRAGRKPDRKSSDSKARDCSSGPGQEPDSDDPSNEESDMKSKVVNLTASTVFALLALASGSADAGQTLEFTVINQGGTPPGEASPGFCITSPRLPNGEVCVGKSDGSAAKTFSSTLSAITNGILEVTRKVDCAVGASGYNLSVGGDGSVTLEVSQDGGPPTKLPIPVQAGFPAEVIGLCRP